MPAPPPPGKKFVYSRNSEFLQYTITPPFIRVYYSCVTMYIKGRLPTKTKPITMPRCCVAVGVFVLSVRLVCFLEW